MNKKQLLFLFATLGVAAAADAQVLVEKPIQMTGTTAGDRRITNVGLAVDSNDAVNATSIQRGYLTYATATGVNNAYVVTLPATAGNYTAGMIVSFRANAANTGSITLNVNGWGAKNVFQNVSTPLVTGDILADQIVTVIYDGTNFQTLSAMAQTINFTGTLSGDVSGTQHATVIEPDAVTTAKILNGAVTTTKISDDAVTTAKILNANVTNAKIADDAVTTSKILNANVTTAKIADANVTTPKLADASVTTAKIVDLNVTTTKIADANVTTPKIADDAVNSAKILNGSIVDADINATAAIAYTKMAGAGAASGSLAGTYPNPTIATTQAAGNNVITSINAGNTSIDGARLTLTNQPASNITTGTLSATVMPAHTGDVTSTAGSVALTIANNGTSGTNIVNAANNAGTTGTWVAARMPAHTGDVTSTAGSVGLSIATTAGTNIVTALNNAGTTGTLVAGRMPAHTGDVTSTAGSVALSIATTAGTNIVTAVNNAGTTGTLAPARLGTGTANTTNYLRGDGSWQVVNGLTAGTQPGQLYLTGAGGTVPTTPVTMTGDVAITSGGVTSIANNGTAGTNIVTALSNGSATGQIPAARLTLTGQNASNISTGTLSTTVMPAFTGDVTTSVGTTTTAIANTGAAGTNIVTAINNGTTTGSIAAARLTLTNQSAANITSGTFGAGDASNLTNLNASQLTTGTVGTARLGTGTADNTTYLRGDGQWVGATPSGAASGDLTGTYPNPTIAANAVTSAKILDNTIVNGDINPSAAIAFSKMESSGAAGGDLTGTYPNPTIAAGAVSSAKILDNSIVNGDINTTAGIAFSKMESGGAAGGDLTGTYPSPTIAANAVTSAKIANGTIVDADISATAGIAFSKMIGAGAAGGDLNGTYPSPTIVNDAVTTNKIANEAVTLDKISTAGATANYAITYDGTIIKWAPAGTGTVTDVSVVSANGFGGSVATSTTTPAITISTSVTGLLKGNGTGVTAATAGTDYLAPNGNGSALTGLSAGQLGTGTLAEARLPQFTGGTVTSATAGSAALTIADNAVTDTKIADNAVINSKILNDAVTEDKIEGSAVSTSKIRNGAVTEAKINTTNATTDGQVLTYNGTTTSVEWRMPSGSGTGYTFLSKNANYVISPTDIVNNVVALGTAATITFTLPSAATAGAGKTVYLTSPENLSINVQTAGGDTMIGAYTPAGTTDFLVASGFRMNAGTFISDGISTWYLVSVM